MTIDSKKLMSGLEALEATYRVLIQHAESDEDLNLIHMSLLRLLDQVTARMADAGWNSGKGMDRLLADIFRTHFTPPRRSAAKVVEIPIAGDDE